MEEEVTNESRRSNTEEEHVCTNGDFFDQAADAPEEEAADDPEEVDEQSKVDENQSSCSSALQWTEQ